MILSRAQVLCHCSPKGLPPLPCCPTVAGNVCHPEYNSCKDKVSYKMSYVRRVFCFHPDFQNSHVFSFLQGSSSLTIHPTWSWLFLTFYTSFCVFALVKPNFYQTFAWQRLKRMMWCIRANDSNSAIFIDAFHPRLEVMVVNCSDRWFPLGFFYIVLEPPYGLITLSSCFCFSWLPFPNHTEVSKKWSLQTTAFSTFTVN